MNQANAEFVYKVTTTALWTKAQSTGVLPPSPIDVTDGFMHLSTAAQLAETLKLHFAGQGDLVVVKIAAAPLGDALKWEPSRGGALFPHLYAALGVSDIAATKGISVAADGSCDLSGAL